MMWTANDPEPPEGTEVIDVDGRRWCRDDGIYGGPGCANWIRVDGGGDPETWTKVAGNYGPVKVQR